MKNKIEFKVEQNLKFGDYRINKYVNNIWVNQIDNNWTKAQANKIAKKYNNLLDN